MKRLPSALLLPLLPGCLSVSAEPLYPADWPALEASADAASGPDLSGTYRAVSEPAGPLEYPAGGRPQETFLFFPIGPPTPAPRLGRRVLAWHLAGAAGPGDEELWRGLSGFAAALGADAEHPDGQDDAGWVRVSRAAAGGWDVECGSGDETLFAFALAPSPARNGWQELWSNPRGYGIEDGALVVTGAFPPSPLECASGAAGVPAGRFAFQRAADGSLAMLEALHFAPEGGEIAFRKWWRWRRVQ